MIRLPRVLRLDLSDTLVFPRAAAPDEVAVAGGFLFWDQDPMALNTKERVAFRSAFLGVVSFGFSTLVAVAEVSPEQHAAAVDALAAHLVRHLGAPDPHTARPAAEEELAHAAALCAGHPVNTVLALSRTLRDGAIHEAFRTLEVRPRQDGPATGLLPVFSVVGEEVAEDVDLTRLVPRA
jgi:hypothetical protein